MKKIFLIAIAISALCGVSAFADVKKPVWDCALTFKAKGGGIQFLVGSYELSGPGKVSCVDVAGNTQSLDVNVKMGGKPVALNVAIGRFDMAGMATGIGVATGPRALLGKYLAVQGNAAFVLGAGANLSLHGGAEAVTLNVGVTVMKGVGVQVGVDTLTITAAE